MDQSLEKKRLTVCPVAWHAQRSPKLVAVETDEAQITFSELHTILISLSLQLAKLNMQKGDRLVSISTDNYVSVLLQLCCLRNGFIFCPINPKFSQVEIKQRLTRLNSHFIWQPGGEKSLDLDFSSPTSPATVINAFKIDPYAVVSIIFTSGSTGIPKAVMHHYSNHYYSALGSQSVIPLSSGDKNLLSLPMFHISGYATVIRSIIAGATIKVSNEKVSVKYLKKQKITHLSLVSTQLQKLLIDEKFYADSLSIKHLLLGGSAFPTKALQETRKRGFNYHLSYGSTEMASQIATSTNNEILQLLPYRQLKIIDNEILLSGKTRFVGYFEGDAHKGLIDKEQYVASSDIGEFSGKTVKINGRKDRQFISGGENIQPEEVEKVLLSYPELSQAYVVPINDTIYGQRPVAFIKWNNGEKPNQLKEFIKDKLVSFKQPLHYFELPEQKGFKINTNKLSKLALQLLLKQQK